MCKWILECVVEVVEFNYYLVHDRVLKIIWDLVMSGVYYGISKDTKILSPDMSMNF